MSLAVFMRGWRRLAGLIGFSLAVAMVTFSTAADPTNAAKIAPRQLREDLIKNQIQNDMFLKWEASHNSLEGVMMPPAARPNFTPAQARQIKEALAEERYWMFANPDDAGKALTLEEQAKLDRAAPGILDGLDAETPRVLQRYYARLSGHRSETNSAVREEGDCRDDLSLKFEDRWLGKSARSKKTESENRSPFNPVGPAASKAISRLFQPNGGRELVVTPNPGLFTDVFSSPDSIPLERSPETVQRRSDFQKLLDAPAAAGNLFSPLPAVPPGAGGFGGLNNFAAPRTASGFPNPAGDSSLLGASTVPAVVAPAPSAVSQFQPVTPPRRRF